MLVSKITAGTRYWTSDWHLGHANILGFDDRPWSSIDAVNWGLINRTNDLVGPDDELWFVGDGPMGDRQQTLPLFGHLVCKNIVFIPGNHDLIHPSQSKAKVERWLPLYRETFPLILSPTLTDLAVQTKVGSHDVQVCHFPYRGDSRYEDRYSAWRPDETHTILHGHTHSREIVSRSKTGLLQVHIGVTAWDYSPVSDEWIIGVINEND